MVSEAGSPAEPEASGLTMTTTAAIEGAAEHIRDQLREGIPHIKIVDRMAESHFWLDDDDLAVAFRRAAQLLEAEAEEMCRYVDQREEGTA